MLRLRFASAALCAGLGIGCASIASPIFTLLSAHREVEGIGMVPGPDGPQQRTYTLEHDSPREGQTAAGAMLQVGLSAASVASTADTFVGSGRIGVRMYAAVTLIHPVGAAEGSLFAEGVSDSMITYRLNRTIEALVGFTGSGTSNSDNGVMGTGGGSFAMWDESASDWVTIVAGPQDGEADVLRSVTLDPGLYTMRVRLFARVSNTAQAADVVVHQGEAYVVVIPAPGSALAASLGLALFVRRRR